jgi:hypothetical protein
MILTNAQLHGSIQSSYEQETKISPSTKVFLAQGEYPFNAELPDATQCVGEMITIVSQSTAHITLTPSVNDTINTATSLNIEPLQTVILQSIGTHWLVVGRAK